MRVTTEQRQHQGHNLLYCRRRVERLRKKRQLVRMMNDFQLPPDQLRSLSDDKLKVIAEFAVTMLMQVVIDGVDRGSRGDPL